MKIENVNTEFYTCLETAVALTINYHNENYKKLVLDSWSFGLNENGYLGKRINLRNNNFGKIFRQNGLDIVRYESLSYKELMISIENELAQKRPVIVYCDSYFCPWSDSFNKYHTNHYFLIIDKAEVNFVCKDNYIIKLGNETQLDHNVFKNFTNEIITVHKFQKKSVDLSFSQDVSDTIKRLKDENVLEKINLFSEQIKAYPNLLVEEANSIRELKYCDLFVKLNFLNWNRNNIAQYLQGIDDSYKKVVNNMYVSADHWGLVRKDIYKYIYLKADNEVINGIIQKLHTIV